MCEREEERVCERESVCVLRPRRGTFLSSAHHINVISISPCFFFCLTKISWLEKIGRTQQQAELRGQGARQGKASTGVLQDGHHIFRELS